MYQKLYKSKHCGRIVSLVVLTLALSACGSFVSREDDHLPGGLVVGAVVNAEGRSALKPYQRWRYADQVASHILAVHPELSGQVDSYEYMAARVGKPFNSLLQEYRLEGGFNEQALEALKQSQLRRRYLMMVNILPNEKSFPLKPDRIPVAGPLNGDVDDYYDVNRQTILLTAVEVRIYDTVNGREIFKSLVRSDEGGQTLATEARSRKYVGNSVLAAISNSISNGLSGSVNGAYPAPPERDDVLDQIWSHIAEQVPSEVF